ncbi:UBA/TS-N domain containing protein [Trichomonas vaginalis G3]|uniref:UV excision repair protein RAD23 n=1 Tax=Trichomonas vaginalis (strain ATCC PRA-98 / G3) TaxID=412133 RepID=A2FM19_TRIV3|nr:UV excision repair protein RAD23 family [Trichomonas vaginalis G3]EAX94060.1 UBA/TS-N domain containing protein [Trichomonas vaginalis G3]KAI5548210.1 UV excision repair protein RAD23 family [Trichomonas vaginalis G3]|eukprot:XP_001306990.1 UBA/TS-N domain containing protein [Trichomonas vaginalis G3]
MIVKIRATTGRIYKLELPQNATVEQLKQAFKKVIGFSQFKVKIKFIYLAYIMEDAKTIESYNIKDTEYIVASLENKNKQDLFDLTSTLYPHNYMYTSLPTNEPLPNFSDSDSMSSSGEDEESESDGFEYCESIEGLQELGFLKSDCQAAIKAAMGNFQIALAYLEAGIIPSKGDVDNFNKFIDNVKANIEVLDENPDHLNQVLNDLEKILPEQGALFRAKPELLIQRLGLNPKDFDLEEIRNTEAIDRITAENEASNPYSPNDEEEPIPDQDPLSKFTPEEQDAIKRLCELGFDIHLVIHVYEACDKNEALTANCLLAMND